MTLPFARRDDGLRDSVDLRCYFVTGSGSSEQIVRQAQAAAAGGAGIIQVRSKPIGPDDLYHLAANLSQQVHSVYPSCAVVVDDDVEVCAQLKRDGYPIAGVHVGQDDLPVERVREILGPGAIIGLTTGTLELIRQANSLADELDYVGCGPFRATPTKDSGRTPLGLAGYREIVPEASVPVVAIGDVTVDDAADLAATGVSGLAIVRALMNAPDAQDYARRVLAEFDRGARHYGSV